MHNSYDQGFNDGEFDAQSSSGYDPDYGVGDSDSYPEYHEGYDNGYESGIQKRREQSRA